MNTKEIKKEYSMRKEWKTDALFTVKALRSAYTAGGHAGLNSLYTYVVGRGKMTKKEIEKFDDLLNKISGSDIQNILSKDIYEDDQFYKDKEKEYEKDHKIRLIYQKAKKEWFKDDEYPENQFDLYVYDMIENKYEDLNDKEIEDIFIAVMEKCEQYDRLKPYIEKAKQRGEK